jgi:hypothetical protein
MPEPVLAVLNDPAEKGRRVQIRLPLDDEDEAILALGLLMAACERSIRVIQSVQRQRNPQLHNPLGTVRATFERVNRAINAKRKGR